MTDDRDNRDDPGISLPPPLIYLVPLVLGLLLDRRAHVPFLPRGAARGLVWTLIGGGVMLSGGSYGRCGRPTRRYAPTSWCRD